MDSSINPVVYTFVFDLTDLPDLYRVNDLDRGYKVNFVHMWMNKGYSDMHFIYSGTVMTYLPNDKIIELSHEAWVQLMHIKDLPLNLIFDHLMSLGVENENTISS